MSINHKYVSAAVLKSEELGDRQIRVVASTPTPDRAKDIMRPDGCILENYRVNPVVLANHNPEHPIGTAQVEIKNGRVEALITFLDKGGSVKADEWCALAKAGVVNTVSVGFEPIEAEPRKGGGFDIRKWELLELSLVPVPCNPEAVVFQRSLHATPAANWKCGASLNLPLVDDEAFDSADACKSIFDHCDFDGDDADTSFARKGFLVYDASKAGEKGAYSIPFAKIVDGRLRASKTGLLAASAQIDGAEISDELKQKARAVLVHYAAKENQPEQGEAGANQTGLPKMKIKGLYEIGRLASLLGEIGYIEDSLEWEREYEGDDSKLPEMLAQVMRSLGEALLALTKEELAELLGREVEEGQLSPDTLDAYKAMKPGFAKAMVVLRIKSGRAISAGNEAKIRDACKSIKQGHDDISDLLDALYSEDPELAEEISETVMDDDGREKRLREIEILSLAVPMVA